MVEIELRERLRRRRDEIRGKIESLGETDAGGESATEDLETRKRELKHLGRSIKELTEKAQGKIIRARIMYHVKHLMCRNREGVRRLGCGATRVEKFTGADPNATDRRQSGHFTPAEEYGTLSFQEASLVIA